MSRSHLATDSSILRETVRGSCMLCGMTDGPVLFEENGYRGRACACGVVYIDPRPEPEAVDLREDHHLDTYYSLPARIRLDWMKGFCATGRVLEVGCGSGHFLALAQEAGYEVAAVEPNAVSARIARERLGIEVEEALIEESLQPAAAYDAVFHVDLLSHFPDPERALRAMARLLRPGGVLCFEVGVFGGLGRAWYPWVGKIGYPQHLWLYSEEAIGALLGRVGLEVTAIRRFGLLPATLLSTIGNFMLRNRISRPRDAAGRAAPARGGYHAYSYLQYLLRYRLGAFVPAIGPYALFVTARPR